MKKIILLLAIIFVSMEAFSQFNIGPKVGYTSSKLTTDLDEIKESIRSNFQVGAFARFGRKLYVQPEIYYATSGGKWETDYSGSSNEIKFKNIGIPVLIGYKLLNAKVVNFRIMTGPVINFIVDKSMSPDSIFQEDNFKNIAWGWDLGTGFDIFFLTLDLRYEFGLNNLFTPSAGEENQNVKSNVFVISLGFKLL